MEQDDADAARRIAGIAAIAGSSLGFLGNLVHPPTFGLSPEEVATTVAQSEIWTPIHIVIVLGIILMLIGLTGICRAVGRMGPSELARLALMAAVAGIAVGTILVTLDGVAAKQLALEWYEAPDERKAAALQVFVAEEIVNFALASLFNILFAGAAYVLLGIAILKAEWRWRPIGWIAVAAGLGSVAAGLIQVASGVPTRLSFILTIIFPTIITLWTAFLGFLLLSGKVSRPTEQRIQAARP